MRLYMYNHKREAAIYRLLCWLSDESLQEELKALRHCQPNCYCCGCLMELRLQNYFIGELWDIWDIYLKKKKPPANYIPCPLFLNPVLACLSTWVLTLACSYRRKAWELPAAGFCPVSTNQHPPSFHHHRRRWSLYQVFLPQHSTKNKMHHYIKLDTFCSIVL